MTRPRIDEWSRPENLILLKGWRMDGLTIEQISDNIGINKTTLYEWMKKKPNIANALKLGKEQADRIIENALFNKAKSGDNTAMIFWLKNRASSRWKDRYQQEVDLTTDFDIEVEDDEA